MASFSAPFFGHNGFQEEGKGKWKKKWKQKAKEKVRKAFTNYLPGNLPRVVFNKVLIEMR